MDLDAPPQMQKADVKHDEVPDEVLAVVSDELDGIQVSTSAKENSDESDAELWAGWHEDTPIIPVIWTCTAGAAMLAVQTYMVHYYCEDSEDMKWGDSPVWLNYLILNVIGLAYSGGIAFLFPKYPTICGIPFFLYQFLPAFLLYAVPFIFTDLGKHFAWFSPLWVSVAWGAVRLVIESSIQMHHAYGVKGFSNWLKWPIQQTDEYSYTYPIIGTVTRTRGGNLDAFSCTVIMLPLALVIGLVDDDNSTAMQVLAGFAQVWMFVYLCVGPFFHFLLGMPGPNNIFDGKGTPKVQTGMQALVRGVMGPIANFAGSYAVVHFVVWLRKYTDDPSRL